MSVANVELMGHKWPTDIFDWPKQEHILYRKYCTFVSPADFVIYILVTHI